MSAIDWVCKKISLESASEQLSAITISRQQVFPSKLDACAKVTTCCSKSVPRSHEPTAALRFFKMAAPRGHLLNLLVILFFGLRGTPFILSRCVSSSRHNLGKSTSPKSDGIVRILGRQCWFSVFTGKSNYIKLSITE